MREGQVNLCFATLMGRNIGQTVHHLDFGSAMQTYGVARGHLAYYRALEHRGLVNIITDLSQLDAHLGQLEAGNSQTGFIISMQSADAILDPQ